MRGLFCAHEMKRHIPIPWQELDRIYGYSPMTDVLLALRDRGIDLEYVEVSEIREDHRHGRYVVVVEDIE